MFKGVIRGLVKERDEALVKLAEYQHVVNAAIDWFKATEAEGNIEVTDKRLAEAVISLKAYLNDR